MKKTLSLVLALSMLLCFVACGGDGGVKENAELKDYLKNNRDFIIGLLSLTENEVLDIAVVGDTYVMDLCFSDTVNATEEDIPALRELFDEESLNPLFADDLATLQEDIPITAIVFNICNGDGAILVTVTIK